MATNACVEHKGGRAKLVFIGVNPQVVKKMGGEYGLPPMGDIYFMKGDAGQPDSLENTPDWQKFEEDIVQDFRDFDSVAIVQMNPKYNDGEYEIKAEQIIKKTLGLPCVRGMTCFRS